MDVNFLKKQQLHPPEFYVELLEDLFSWGSVLSCNAETAKERDM